MHVKIILDSYILIFILLTPNIVFIVHNIIHIIFKVYLYIIIHNGFNIYNIFYVYIWYEHWQSATTSYIITCRWLGVAWSVHSTAEMIQVYVSADVASSPMGNHPQFLAKNHSNTYEHVSTNHSNHFLPTTNKKKQLMVIVTGSIKK